MLIEALDGITPAEAFMGLRNLPMPFIFSGGKDRLQNRYSFLGAAPFMTLRAGNGGTIIIEVGAERLLQKDPFMAISEIIEGLQCKRHPECDPFPFISGAAGYFSYDLNNVIEPGRFRKSKVGTGVPPCIIGFYDPIFVYDHHERSGYVVSRNDNRKRCKFFIDSITRSKIPVSTERPAAVEIGGLPFSTHGKAEYMSAVTRAKEYMAAGDIYQINLSQRLSIPLKVDPFSLYVTLTERSPAPFSSFMDFGGFQIISNSPERLLKVSDGYAETSPIKGTRPRGASREEDMFFIEELKKSPKERAEHVMIVDLMRNDLGRISLPGSVKVTDFETIETFPNLHHMVSTIRGRLKAGVDPASALRSVFPGGSVTGAPKIRAMEIIDELEPVQRSVYTGGMGWIDLGGEMDIAMTIRTALCKDGFLHLGVGGGIVADSVPEDEYDETLLKARSFIEVMDMELQGSGLLR